MKLFEELGEKIEKLWRDQDFNEAVFPSLAARCLQEANLPDKISAWQVIEWTLAQDVLPLQQDLHSKFGDPPITIYNGSRFYLDVYFWLEGTTAIHQHAFCGAFQVLHGSSIHSWYEFECRDKINAFTEIGDIRLKVCELLKVGDVQEILPGRQYIHSLFHLDQPSATIVVRTSQSPLYLPQFDYRKPLLTIDPFFEEPNTTKKLQCLSALVRSKHPDTDKFISEWLEIADFQTTYVILMHVRGYLQANQVEQLFNLEAKQNRFEKMMEIVRQRHGARADIFPKVFAHQTKLETIVHQRSYVTDAEHRFFLALLMNIDGRERIFELIKARFPESDPLDKILDWTFDLAQTRVVGTNLPNALGVADFDDLDLLILENLLQDKSVEEIQATLEKEYGAENAAEVSGKLPEKIDKLLQTVIFQPLLAN